MDSCVSSVNNEVTFASGSRILIVPWRDTTFGYSQLISPFGNAAFLSPHFDGRHKETPLNGSPPRSAYAFPHIRISILDIFIDNIQIQQNRLEPVLFRQNGERTEWEKGRKVKDGVAREMRSERARARGQPDTSERDRGNRAGPEREKSTKFISGHPRAEPRPGTNSIASVALFRERAHGTLAGAGGEGMVGVNGWLVGRRPSDSAPSSSLSPFFVCRDPASPPPPPLVPLRCRHPPVHPDLLPLLRYCPPSSRRGSGPRVISAFMGRDRHGSSGNVPDDGEKKLRQEWVVGCSERGTKLIIRALWLPRNPYHSFRTIVEIPHDVGR
ncbi:hypothetical protein DBV15_03147 [Temnothorax longispinosus]|uniref:Uncharacterized protein n=1 Tax=Temnothorax longispinosus TaxID=300112 RepID=A0A4S2KNU7_9HYME|nr:hypothetical protein DBV15_03147 [Temnothorax longispinosus]